MTPLPLEVAENAAFKTPEAQALSDFVAKQMAQGTGNVVGSVELADAIGEVEEETQILGSDFVKVHIIDPEWTLQNSGFIKINSDGLLDPEVEIEFPSGSGRFWVSCAVEGSTEILEPNFVIIFEDKIFNDLKGYWGPRYATPGTTTRAQLIRQLLVEAGIKAVIPGLNVVQPVEEEKKGEQGQTIIEAQDETKNKSQGAGAGAAISIKGAKPNAQQLKDINTALATAQKLKAPQAAVEALIYAGIAESSFNRADSNASGHMGIWQSDIIPGNEVAKQAEFFLKGGESFQGGGAIKLAKEGKHPIEIAELVEAGGSYASESGSANFLPEAQAIIQAAGGIAQSASTEAVSDVGQLKRGVDGNPDEDSAECIKRLAQAVDWFAFSNGKWFYYMDGPELARQTPALRVDMPGSKVTRPDGQVEHGVVLIPSNYTFDQPLALDTLIPTPAGWTTMGDVQAGDIVFGADGKPTRVLGVSPIFKDRRCYRVVFSDGSSIVADEEHVWETRVTMPNMAEEDRVAMRSTAEIATTLRWPVKDYRLQHQVRVAAPLDLPECALPVDPYILGYWLGDGRSNGPLITVADEDLASLLEQLDRAGYSYHLAEEENTGWAVGKSWRVQFSLQHPYRKSHRHEDNLSRRLRDLGVLGAKHIPELYLRASESQRVALLQGLMDSDGSVGASCQIGLSDGRLAGDVLELMHSLGLRVNHETREASDRNQVRKPRHLMQFAARDHLVPFRLSRKAERYCEQINVRTRSRCAHRTIVAVEDVSSVPVKCIGVEAPDHLFLVGREMIPTRNTSFEYQQTHKVRKKSQRRSRAVKPTSPSEVKLHLLCAIGQYLAGEVFVFENSGLASDIGRWLVVQTTRKCFRNPYTEIILQPPPEPLPEPKETTKEEAPAASETEGGGASEQAKKAYSEKGKYVYSELPNRSNNGTLFGPAPRTMDCSSFVILTYKDAGLPDPTGNEYKTIGDTETLIANCEKVTGNPTKDDLCFYEGAETATHPQHVTLYIGGGKAIGMEAPGVNLLEGTPEALGPAKFLGYYRPKNYPSS